MRHIAAVPIAVRAGFQRRAVSPRAQSQRRLGSARRVASTAAAVYSSSATTTTMALSLPAAVAIPVLGGFGVATRMDHQLKTWYPSLRKPWWTPPNWAFPVAWTALYVAMGAASWLVWRDGGVAEHPLPLALYVAQLLLNWAWSPLFFTAHRLGAALLDATLQLISIAACIATFYPVSHAAAYLMVPLLAWVTYATALNAKILDMNRRKRD